MEVTTFILFSLVICLIIAYFVKNYYDNKDLPPGPRGIPILGYLPFFKPADINGAIKDISSKYGPVCSAWFGSKLVVFLCDYDSAKEAFVKLSDHFHGRPKNLFTINFSNKNRGVIMNEGEEWKILRRYSMSNMRDFGMGKLSLQGKIQEEIFHLFENIESTDGHSVSFNPRSVLSAATTNVLCNIMCGHRFDYKDREFKGLVESIYSALSEGYVGFITWFPIFRFIPPFKKAMDFMWDNTYYIWNFSSDLIRSAKKAMDAGEEETTLLQSIVNEAKNSDPARAAVFNKNILYNTCQLYLAGAETTSTSLEWCCYWMMLKPELQKRMQDEIDKNIDPSCLPRIEDKSKLPLAEAFSLEILRMCPPLPLGVPHATTSETWLRGYRIPERTIVFSHLAGAQQDPKLFDKPSEFNPDRFIDKNGKVDYRKTGFVPFGVGKRQCLGEALARMELFCFLTSILQNYNVVCPPDQHLEIPERIKTGITCHPPNFQILLQPRYTNKQEFFKRFESLN